MSLESSIASVVESQGYFLYDILKTKDSGNNIFRVYITKQGGVSLDDCATISRLLSPMLDVDEPMSGLYRLEVSSPGIERKLKTFDNFVASVGENIKGKEFSTEIFRGKLLEIKDGQILSFLGEDNTSFDIPYDDILSASTYFEW